MSEFDRLEAGDQKSCKMAHAISRVFDPDDQRELQDALKGEYRYSTYVAWFAKRNLHLSDKTVARHLRGECPCDRA